MGTRSVRSPSRLTPSRSGPSRVTRRGGRRPAPALSPVRPRVGGGIGAPARVVEAADPVVIRRRRVAAIVLGALLVGLVTLAAVLLAGPAAGSASSGGAVPQETTVTVVRGGESLSDVARRAAPRADTDATVARIRELNALPSVALSSGRPLVVPAG